MTLASCFQWCYFFRERTHKTMTPSCNLEMPNNNTSGKILFSLELKYSFFTIERKHEILKSLGMPCRKSIYIGKKKEKVVGNCSHKLIAN